jgi:hypothetical protein
MTSRATNPHYGMTSRATDPHYGMTSRATNLHYGMPSRATNPTQVRQGRKHGEDGRYGSSLCTELNVQRIRIRHFPRIQAYCCGCEAHLASVSIACFSQLSSVNQLHASLNCRLSINSMLLGWLLLELRVHRFCHTPLKGHWERGYGRIGLTMNSATEP